MRGKDKSETPSVSTQLDVKNPRTGETDYHIAALSAAEVKALANRLRAAQPAWLARGMAGRGEALSVLSNALETRATEIIAALAVDTGRRKIAEQEVMGVVSALRGWAGLAPTLMPAPDWVQGRTKPYFKHQNDYVPYSLVGVISPWNFPMTLSFIDTIPALMAGACVMIKPSEVTPRFADVVTEVIADAGMSDSLAFAQGAGDTGGALIDYVDCVCFTGSVATGRKVAVKAAENLIPVNLELGGKDPLIITASANMDKAAALALRASVLATGQACQSIERIYVPRTHYEDFLNRLVTEADAAILTYPEITEGHIGPFIFDKQADIVRAQIVDAKTKGARVLTGGDILTHGGGQWLRPTVIADVTHDMDIMVEETFGPVMPVMAYETIEQAVSLANDTNFGLSAAVYAGTIAEAREIAEPINAGAISLMDGALTGQYFEAGKQSFKNSGLGPSRMGANGFLRFFRQKAYIANTIDPLTLDDFAE